MRQIATPSAATFYESLPGLDSFSQLANPNVYRPVPAGWHLGLADIVDSTHAIEDGRYKDVNTAAASVIAAVSNALPAHPIPFVFGGDGASFAVPPEDAPAGSTALARTATWIAANFGLEMRVAMLPVEDIRAEGFDLRLARFEVAPGVSYAMFAGGGLAFAENGMKAGRYKLAPATDGEGPDLDGLSCRFSELPARRGIILSVIVMPPQGGIGTFPDVAASLLEIADMELEAGRPVPEGGPPMSWTLSGFRSELRTASARTGRSRFVSAIRIGLRQAFSLAILGLGRRIGGFDPKRYFQELVTNSDYRKFDDGLRMTIDCTPQTADRIEALLERAQADGTAVYGLHRQSGALMTCFVPAPSRNDHVHFIDGAAGGYAMAARALKGKLQAVPPPGIPA